jgi:uncharacterized protein YxjI
MTPRLIVEQKITAFTNKYTVYAANPDESKGDVIAFAQQKRIAFKEKVSFYTNESKEQLAFTFRAEKVMDIHGRYFVEDPNGQLIGAFRKVFKDSLLKSTWTILDQNDAPRLTITESNVALALLRRFGGFVPFIGDLIEIVVLFFRYHFSVLDTTNAKVGLYQKTTLFRDHYKLSMTDEAYAKEDPRVLAAVAVALDALQSR